MWLVGSSETLQGGTKRQVPCLVCLHRPPFFIAHTIVICYMGWRLARVFGWGFALHTCPSLPMPCRHALQVFGTQLDSWTHTRVSIRLLHTTHLVISHTTAILSFLSCTRYCLTYTIFNYCYSYSTTHVCLLFVMCVSPSTFPPLAMVFVGLCCGILHGHAHTRFSLCVLLSQLSGSSFSLTWHGLDDVS